MSGRAFSWWRVGLPAATGGVFVLTSFVTAASAFADADDPLSGSDTAIILGGTFEPTPDTAFAQAAENLYLHPLGFDGGATASTVCDMVGTDPCAAPLQVLTTPDLLEQGPSTQTGADDVALAVENEFAANPGAFSAERPLTVFGYSQSAAAESLAMTQIYDYSVAHGDSIPLADVHFVLIGDPSLPGGIGPDLQPTLDAVYGTAEGDQIFSEIGFSGAPAGLTPDDLYPATIYSLDGDGVADFEQDYASGGFGSVLYNFFTTHAEYLGLTPTQIADATTSIDGSLTNIDISAADVNGFDALMGALDNGIGGSGLFESLFQSLELAFTNMF